MTISYSWLRRYLNFNPSEVTPDLVSEILTRTGLEVEGTEEVESVKGGLQGVTVGKVLTCEKHPDADRLKVTTVDVGAEAPLNIVCGAPNVAAGQLVPVATIGTVLYPGGGEERLKIKKGKIRGQVSEGMICAEDELGLGQSHDGILVLDEAKAKVGMSAAEYFELESDVVFEIGLTPNRTDALGHYGVARDLLAGLLRDGISSDLSLPSVVAFSPDHLERPFKITVEDTEGCPQYLGVTLTDVKVADSPSWLKNALLSIGIQPINNVVDITNFVLHETGHPLHAFDGDKIANDHVIVRTLPSGSKFTTLDEKERELDSTDLMITDSEGGKCIAGVFGGLESGVSESTTTVFLEAAWFNPVRVRKTAKRHALNTDASFRYERGVDPLLTSYALKRAALLIKDVAGAKIGSDMVSEVARKFEPVAIDLSYDRMYRLLGQEIPREEILKILDSLEFVVAGENGDYLKVLSPVYRWDVTREADVVEEILRIYGFDNIEFPEGMRMSMPHSEKRHPDDMRRKVNDILVGMGLTEIMNNSLTKKSYYEGNNDFSEGETVDILNPLSQDLGVMRRTLLFGGLETIAYNFNRQQKGVRCFEFGKVYAKQDGKFTEKNSLALWISGVKTAQHWNHGSENSSFFTLKGIVESLFEKCAIQTQLKPLADNGLFADGLDIYAQGRKVGSIGFVPRKYLKVADVDDVVYFAELDWDMLLPMIQRTKVKYKDIPKTFAVQRDLALLVNSDVQYADLERTARKAEKKWLNNVDLFDVYEGKNLPEGKKSYGLRFTLLDVEQTLNDAQLDKTMAKIQEALEKEYSAELR
ncbi:phenylalanine--tRNA ligase subunit beta [Phaeocystidibacter luteus]|uniref:Phenylalanine--tRNA ligase beta subunit n=1 Tax=Phaeocystidibacter luteus TaxID=911197 RepID=A0A6N6RF91_9FLAO|nr:phenylalanine--tRNA ligase subunit beta [Phaeocystidibacter luteus]KAB2806824.1 phenylalanine--tRNA ligase subunit beta [Phaeocystidibacter luteus]